MESLEGVKDLLRSGGQKTGALGATDRIFVQESGNTQSRISTIKDYVTTITILESISEAIFILNTEGRIEYANRNGIELLQTNLDDLIGKFIDEIIIDSLDVYAIDDQTDRDQSTSRSQALIEKLNQGVFGDIEATLVNNGCLIPVFLNFSVISDIDGNANYIIVTAKDISHRKVLEKELRQQQALSISRDRLRALGELSMGLMHELSQPLATLKLKVEKMYTRIRSDDEAERKMKKNHAEMLELIDRMSNTIQNIRIFAHQTEDDTIAMVNINEIVKNACHLVSYELKKRNVRLIVDKEKGLPYVIANPLSLEQVIVNLLTNARDAFDDMTRKENCPDGEGKMVKITTKSIEDKWVEIGVEDNAGGIDSKIREKIFEPFFTTKEPGINSGVGLSISKNIITSLGGDIKVTVREGKGSKFRVRIPVGQGEERMQLFNLIEMLHQG